MLRHRWDQLKASFIVSDAGCGRYSKGSAQPLESHLRFSSDSNGSAAALTDGCFPARKNK